MLNFSGTSRKDEVINRCEVLTENITTNVHLNETRGNIINLKCDFENMEFEKVEDEDSGFFIQEKSSNEAFEEEIDEDIVVISIINKETRDSKVTKSTIELKEKEDSGFCIQQKCSNEAFEEEIDEDITVISIINKETGDSKIDKSTIVLKEEEYEVEAIIDYQATVSSTHLSLDIYINIWNVINFSSSFRDKESIW